MSEDKKEKVKFEEHEKRAFWIIGFAVILFLVLVFGGIILLKVTRNVLDDVNDLDGNLVIGGEEIKNYTTDEDGERRNVSEGVVDAEFEVAGRRFSHFNIREYAGLSTIDATVENLTEETLPESDFVLTFYDDNGDALDEIVVSIREIEPRNMEMLIATVEEDIVNAKSIDVKEVPSSVEVSE